MMHLIDISPHSTNTANTLYYNRVHCTFTAIAVHYREHPSPSYTTNWI